MQKRLGPSWTGKGRPPAGRFYTKRTAEAELRRILGDADRGIGHAPRTGATFAYVPEAWYQHDVHEGGSRGTPWKPSTRRDYRSALDRHLLPAFADRRIETITTATIEAWRPDRIANGIGASLPSSTISKAPSSSTRTLFPLGQVVRLRRGRTVVRFQIEALHLKPGLYHLGWWIYDALGGMVLDGVEAGASIEVVDENSHVLGIQPADDGLVSCKFGVFAEPVMK